MVRWFWQNRLIHGLQRPIRLFLRWLLIWLSYLFRRASRSVLVAQRMLGLLVKPRDPNNVFVSDVKAAHEAAEVAVTGIASMTEGGTGTTLLWAGEEHDKAVGQPETDAVSLWQGTRKVTAEDAAPGAEAANRRYAFIELLAAQIKFLKPEAVDQLDELIQRLARKWLDIEQIFESRPKRNRLDVDQTLRHNIGRYAGHILTFRWATKEKPIPQFARPARILVIGDVSHSIVHYVSVILYFFHKLTFRFTIDSYVFSEKPTHAAPFLNGLGTFTEKVQRLVAGARSWNAGTRFGSALEEIAESALVDEYTYVIIATDGKVSLQGDEPNKIERHMNELRRRARQVIFLTPSPEFSDGAAGKVKDDRLGSFRFGFQEIPIYAVGARRWYGTLGQYADRLYLIRTIQDLIDMTEDLVLNSRQP
ncbi:MAG TPA: VWA domain-containing protein [Symbiobacteriaceae bacterium]|nr:VWA domain-containing protein [Symbiobacteriaceae bacterium]